MTVGGNPQNLRFGIVNEDMENFTSCEDYASKMPTGVEYTDTDCLFRGLSCHFLTDFYNSLDVKVVGGCLRLQANDRKMRHSFT